MNILGMNIDWFKFMILLIVGLIVVGPEKLPSFARKAAKVIRNFQKVTNVISGEITKAMDLNDDEGGNARDFKKDLMAVKRTLEADVAELKSALDSQAKFISETVESGTRETAASFEKQAKEISDTVNTQVAGINTSLQEQAGVVSATIEAGINPTESAVNQPVVEIPAATETPAPAEPIYPESMTKQPDEATIQRIPQPFSPAPGEPEAS